jgi:signal transduction histidine kinase
VRERSVSRPADEPRGGGNHHPRRGAGHPDHRQDGPLPRVPRAVENPSVATASTTGGSQDRAPGRIWWPWLAFAVFIATFVPGMVFHVLNGLDVLSTIPFVLAFTMFSLVGLLIVTHDRRNRVGILLLVGSLIMVACSSAGDFATWALAQGHEGPVVAIPALTTNLGWLLGLLLPVFLLPLLFPDGQLPSRRWRPLVWCVAVFIAVVAVWLLLGQRLLSGTGNRDIGVRNPLFLDAIGRVKLEPFIALTVPLLFGLSVLSLVLRFRRSSGVERQQIKWVAFGLPLSVLTLVVSGFVGNETLVGSVLGGASYLVFPVTIGIAILRFHLYDLDFVIRKTLVYGALAAFVTVVYAGIVIGVGAVVGGRNNLALSIAATAIVAVAFQPVRERATRIANRLVYGKRATPYEVLARFGDRVAATYASEDVLPRMARSVAEGTGAERVEVWLRLGDAWRRGAVWQSDAGETPAMDNQASAAGSAEPPAGSVEVRNRGELLGAIEVAKPASEPLTPAEVALIEDLAGQAGLVLSNARMTAELQERVDALGHRTEELRESRRRIVAAHDTERRRLERNIHDGAQQHLVALAVKLRLVKAIIAKDPERGTAVLQELRTQIGDAVGTLTSLALGIYPPILEERGIAAAIESQARIGALPVIVDADGVGRAPIEAEAAVYFCCLEAIQNATKYAEPTQVSVWLGRDGDAIVFEVADDGRGFDPATTPPGSGLRNMADRLSVLGGAVDVISSLGHGTTIRGRLPATLEAR